MRLFMLAKNNSATPSHILSFCSLLVLIVCSCGTSRNLVYFDDLNTDTLALVNNDITPRIRSKDILSINVSSLDPESNSLFNTGKISPNTAIATESMSEGFLVNEDGYINFPVVGKVLLRGLSLEEATEKMTLLISQYLKNPIVNIRFLNYTVTVLGEVVNPSTFTVPSPSINILQALAMAGDMTVFGKRENVLLIREVNGVRVTTRINLNDKALLNSPNFYLQQNDIVYVEPHSRSKVAQVSPFNRFIPVVVSAISALAVYLSISR